MMSTLSIFDNPLSPPNAKKKDPDLVGKAQKSTNKEEAAPLFTESLLTPQPLAARMRPKSLDEFVGQEHILGPDKLLRQAIEQDRLFSSIILWGTPGIGKTTLALIIAKKTKSYFESISAVTSGVTEIRELIKRAHQQRAIYNRRTIVLVDEIHRFNKAQQDALLPHVEDGVIMLIGATTENPYFEVVPALVSRSRIFQLKALTEDHVLTLLRRALADKDNGYGKRTITISDEALAHIAHLSAGDARNALNGLELVIESAKADVSGAYGIDLAHAEEAMQQRSIRYDRAGDEHYNTISAFIKSVRGSNPDAALYWLAKMVYAGEDPKFIMRRLFILASEDIGLADPWGIVIVSACSRAIEWCGLPEAQYHLAHATVYLATAPKSNTMTQYFNALKEVEKNGHTKVPRHLINLMKDGECEGHKVGYKYPHDFPGHWCEQQYLPDELVGKHFYNPSDQGHERKIAERLKIWRGESQE